MSKAQDIPTEERKNPFRSEKKDKPSFFGSFIHDVIITASDLSLLATINIFVMYVFLVFYISKVTVSFWIFLVYPLLVLICYRLRNAWKEKERRLIAHRLPFFADAIGNALAVGCTLDQAFEQSVYYLKGNFKIAFEKVMLKISLGKKLGPLLNQIDEKYPNTGLRYLICLLVEYEDLGIGISPLLKRIAEALKVKEEAEEKVKTILSGGSSYAKLSMVVFGISFLSFGMLLKDQVNMLLSPTLKPILLMLIMFAFLGMFIVLRITSLKFSNHYALRPHAQAFMKKKEWKIEELLDYCGIEKNLHIWNRIFLFAPLIVGFCAAYAVSLYNQELIFIGFGYILGIVIGRFCVEFILKGLVEDQLIRAVETFPDFLQVFIIGLNSGLNQFKAFEFAENAITGNAPELLRKELVRAKSALICGENNAKVWQRLMSRLPFETIIDFCELMIISPLHGESIIKSLEQLMSTYQTKKLNLVEKKATKLSQYVIPVIVIAFFPLFLFAVFGPLWIKISALFN